MRLIDADALKKRSLDVQTTSYKTKSTYTIIHTRAAKGVTVEDIDNAPTIEAEPVRYGRWIRSQNGLYACSVCGVNDLFGLSSYCPNCRAKMYGGAS